MDVTQQIQLKQGATFALKCTYTPADGALATLQGATITSQIRKSNTLVMDLDVELASDGLSFTADGGDTSNWPLGVAQWDLRIEVDATVYYTNTVVIQVLRSITEPAP